MNDSSLPELFHRADLSAELNQGRFLLLQKLEIGALALSALLFELTIEVSDLQLGPLLAATTLAVALGARILRRVRRYEERWGTSRKVAETARSLGWQFAAAGGDFPEEMTQAEARAKITERFAELGNGHVDNNPAATAWTDPMTVARQSAFLVRQELYLEHRLIDQRDWYRAKAVASGDRARSWNAVIASLEALGLATAVAFGVGWINLGLASVFGATAAAAVAWQQAKRFGFLKTVYSSMAEKLTDLAPIVGAVDEEDDWPGLVAEVEAILDHENNRWLDNRTLQ